MARFSMLWLFYSTFAILFVLFCCLSAAPVDVKIQHRNGTNLNSTLASKGNLTGVLSDSLDSEDESPSPDEGQGGADVESDNEKFETIEASDTDMQNDDASGETGNFFEGDITSVDPSMSQDALEELSNDNAIKGFLWPSGRVPFVISKDEFTSTEMANIKKAMKEYHTLTCIRWVPRTTESAYVLFKRTEKGCFSAVGRQGTGQKTNYGDGCWSLGTLEHEMMHIIGFYHEQSRSDRDQFVTINFNNVQPELKNNFKKYSDAETVALGATYDYESIMHYPRTAFAIDSSQPTIITKDPDFATAIGQRKKFSGTDLFKINKLYNC